VIHVDAGVLVFACVLSLATGILLGILPALGTTRIALSASLKDGAKGTGGMQSRKLGGVLIISEVALCLILLIGAGLLLQSVRKLLSADPGFQADRLLTMRFYVPSRRFEGDGKNRFGPHLAESLAAVPGVESAAVTFIDPFVWSGFSRGFTIEGQGPLTTAEQDATFYQEIGPAFFRTMAIPLKKGREFNMGDDLRGPGRVIVNEAFVRRYWPGQNPVGKRMKYGPADSHYAWMEVIGVTGDSKFESLRQVAGDTPVIYGALLQSEVIINMSLIVRTKSDPAAMITTLREAIQRFDPEIPVYNVATLDKRMQKDAAETRSYAFLLGLFAVLALVLAAVGIYSVIGYWVSRRTQEMGVRLALGAYRRDVLRLVLGEAMQLMGTGVTVGIVCSLLVMRALQRMLFGVASGDPLTYAALASLLVIIGCLACLVPAWRATRVDPMVALRHE
jgi:putative ABC transport system permease protein